MRTKCVAIRLVKLKNRRVMLFHYASGRWQIKTRILLYTPEGKVALSHESMILSGEAMKAVASAYAHILENPTIDSAKLFQKKYRKSCKGCCSLITKNKVTFCKGGRGILNPKTGKMTPGPTCEVE